MPELPEVETVRRDVAARYVGDQLVSLEVIGARTVRRHDRSALDMLTNRRLQGTHRHGKYLMLEWEGGECLVVHLRMSGQLLAYGAGPADRPKHTHAVFTFRRQGELVFVDPRTFGELFLPSQLGAHPGDGDGSKGGLPPGVAHLGPDALALTVQHLTAVAAQRRLPIKALLADQVAVAGIGNIYSDEICWHAGVSPVTPSGELKPAQLRRLVDATQNVLRAAIEARGSTLGDRQYCDLYGLPGSYQLQHGVYGRSDCRKCGGAIVRARSGPRLAYWCPRCQR